MGAIEGKQVRVRMADRTINLLTDIQIHHKEHGLPSSFEAVLEESIEYLHNHLFNRR
jgi:hypothetical protein